MALTFQRLDGEYRAKGLELFERLFDIGVNDAFMTLQELDRRMLNPLAEVFRRRQKTTTP